MNQDRLPSHAGRVLSDLLYSSKIGPGLLLYIFTDLSITFDFLCESLHFLFSCWRAPKFVLSNELAFRNLLTFLAGLLISKVDVFIVSLILSLASLFSSIIYVDPLNSFIKEIGKQMTLVTHHSAGKRVWAVGSFFN